MTKKTNKCEYNEKINNLVISRDLIFGIGLVFVFGGAFSLLLNQDLLNSIYTGFAMMCIALLLATYIKFIGDSE